MEKRRSNRIVINLDAKLISTGKSYTGFIENLSEFGIKWYQYAGDIKSISGDNLNMLSAMDFTPGSTLEIKFKLPSGEIINLLCKVIWLKKVPPNGHLNSIGMKIIDSPPKYKEFLKTP